jgi:hypothetical protein
MQRILGSANVLAFASLMMPISVSADGEDRIQVVRSRTTGNASFVSMSHGGIIPVRTNTAALAGPLDFFRTYGHLFGIHDADRQLQQIAMSQDDLGTLHTEFRFSCARVRRFAQNPPNDRGSLKPMASFSRFPKDRHKN